MEKYYYVSGLDGRADSVQTIMETILNADRSVLETLDTRFIMKYENHFIVPLFNIIYITPQKEIRFAPIRGGKRDSLSWKSFSLMRYFSYSEFLKSDVAEKYQITNIPDSAQLLQVLDNIKALVDNILDPLRAKIGRPIIITSGYRCQQVNELVGGSKTSQHLSGKAADIHVQGYTPQQMDMVYRTIQMYYDFDQLIFYPSKNIIHISWNGDKNRQKSWVKA